jgi:hypothetical protein
LKLNEDYVVTYSNNTNVGIATLTITGTNGYYGKKTYTFQITQKPVTVKWSATDFPYDGKSHVPTATAVGLCGKDTANITVVASGGHTNVGTYTATATAISNKNYKLSGTLKTEYRIGKAIDFEGKNKATVDTKDEVYKAEAITKDVSVAGLTKDKDYSVTFKNNCNAGTATITIKGIGEYSGEKSYSFKIAKLDITSATIILSGSLTYNGTEQTQSVYSVKVGDFVVPVADYEVTNNKQKDAGTYKDDNALKITPKTNNVSGTPTKQWTISPIDISKATIKLGSAMTYNGEEQTQTVASVKYGDFTVPATDYEVTNNKQKNAGTYKDENALKIIPKNENLTGTPTKQWTISVLDISKATIHFAEALVYNGSEQTPSVAVKMGDATLPVTDYEVTCNPQIDAGTYSGDDAVKISSKTVNMTGTITKEFTIEKATPVYAPAGLKGDFTKALSTVTLPDPTSTETPAKSITWSSGSTLMNERGFKKFKVTFIPTDTKNYKTMTDLDVTVEVLGVIVTFNASAPAAGYTITMDDSSVGSIEKIFIYDDKEASEPVYTYVAADLPKLKITSANADGYYFAGWATSPTGTYGPTSLQMVDTTVSSDTQYYAVWLTPKGYWLGSANATTEFVDEAYFAENDINYHSAAEIESDMKALHDSSSSTYNAVKAKWDGYYDNADSTSTGKGYWARLYATYKGGETEPSYDGVRSELNKYVEFRILEVSGAGGHAFSGVGATGCDESAVTFMATHVLPTCYAMNETATNVGGWGACQLRKDLNNVDGVDGVIYSKFSSDFKNAVKSVTKEYNEGGDNNTQTDTPATIASKFWLLSYTEFVSPTASNYSEFNPKYEGTQYAWCVSNVTNADGANPNLGSAIKTRDGRTPAGGNNPYCWAWERSASVYKDGDAFTFIGFTGYLGSGLDAGKPESVLPAFAF